MKFISRQIEFGLFMMFRNFLILLILPLSLLGAENIKAVGAVSKANIKAIGAVAEANVKAFGAVDNTSGGGGPDTYYYSALGSNPMAIESFWFAEVTVGAPVTASAAGTVTKIGAKINNTEGATNHISFALWKDVGGTWTFHECGMVVATASTAGNVEITLSSPYTIGIGETVRVIYVSADQGGNVGWYGDSTGVGGFRETRTYANICSATLPSFGSDSVVSAFIYVD